MRERVLGGGQAARAEHLDALVVAVHRLAAVVDHGETAALVGERHDGGVHIVRLRVRLLHAQRAAREDLRDLAAGDEAGHVEVVDRHVEEDPAGDEHVRERRWLGVAARDPHQVRLADGAGGHGSAHRRVRRVEAAVEADLERHAGVLDGAERAIHLVEVERHRLLAEDGLARLGRGEQQRRVGVGARADRDGVDVGRGEQLLGCRERAHPELAPSARAASGRASFTAATRAPGTSPASRRAWVDRSGRRRSHPPRAGRRRGSAGAARGLRWSRAAHSVLPQRDDLFPATTFRGAEQGRLDRHPVERLLEPWPEPAPLGQRAAELVVLDRHEVLEADAVGAPRNEVAVEGEAVTAEHAREAGVEAVAPRYSCSSFMRSKFQPSAPRVP